MIRIGIAVALGALATALPAQPVTAPSASALAQPTTAAQELPYDRGYDKDSPKHAAIDAVEAPATQALNEESEARASPGLPIDGPAADRYRADLAAYETAVVANQAKVARDEAHFARQRSAYAQAMAAWRVQAAACEDGKRKLCAQPAPKPSDFY